MAACQYPGEHRHRWMVLARKGSYHPRHEFRWVPSNFSAVYCPGCACSWRTTALYVDNLPDADHSAEHKSPLAARVTAIVDEYPLVAELTYLGNGGCADRNHFLADVGVKLLRFGQMTYRQVAAVEGAIQQAMAREAAEDEQRGDLAQYGAELAPNGPHTVVGEIEAVWWEDPSERAPGRLRMHVRADDGYRVECTVPAHLRAAHDGELSGRRIELPVTLRRKRPSPTEAWGTYPSRHARLLDDAAATAHP